ncbi:hypothetical protein I79_018684 [Cricetulus griseus]|uniref:Uncharacterized protein n=1 Tax=Cricetulus griseus TaxID=10029 RepID=G3I5D9_CRIGR|nr:hypothetical protein I79_018684 [Cricetulus griseus]
MRGSSCSRLIGPDLTGSHSHSPDLRLRPHSAPSPRATPQQRKEVTLPERKGGETVQRQRRGERQPLIGNF